ncbi:UTRA domain-containing protein [Hoeflea prorocentri]|uniref:UTRA domain-containing protein n=1 Tax=Hoeflea prorocentri TaxID=1922333 RepID=A0A9X3UJK4_9HYPH|nr:UTRA domain-containing protein [Hoeflea prorocentri]MCY6382000.1 UTRA domain-containing protein [Hoeflea prorocentri]MDA5399800.1 UTRA domain-containing protein [Hoeflea prorocentri]
MRSYKDIQNILLERIKGGDWPPGTLLPAEADLAHEFGCTRVTVNRAMRALAESGLVERKRKAGTRVVQRQSRNAMFEIPLVRDEIEQRGGTYKYLLVSRTLEKPPQKVRAEMGLTGKHRVLHVVSLHFADGAPHQIEDRWIDLNVVPQARNETFESVSPNEWLLRQVPYTSAEHVFRAALPSKGEGDLLNLTEGKPVFVIERTTWLAGEAVTHVRLVHPADSFRLVTRDRFGDGV